MPLQLHQNINLLSLLVVGSFVANIYLDWESIVLILLYTFLVEHILLYFNKNRGFYLSYASLSTAVGVIVLMYSEKLWIYGIVIGLGLLQKHLLTIEKRHLFNPSNFALIMALLFFYHDAHIISGQFGDELWLSLVVSLLAIIILIRVDRWMIPLVFMIGYLLFEYFWVCSYDPVLKFEDIYHRFYGVSSVLFVYFMLTDPPVTPNRLEYQMIFGLLIALIATLLDRWYGFRIQHLFMAVFLLSPLEVILSVKIPWSKRWRYLAILMVAVVAILWVIEQQPPYYFEMNG